MKRIFRPAALLLAAAACAAMLLLNGCRPRNPVYELTGCVQNYQAQSQKPYEDAVVIGSMTFEKYGDGYGITGYNGEFTVLAVPESYRGKPVVRIGDGVFAGDMNLSTVYIPASVTEIGEEAFRNCSRLVEVNIDGPAHIGDSAFRSCSNLNRINLRQTLTIGREAFCHTSVSSISLPETLTDIGANAFQSTNLKTVNFPDSLLSIGSQAFLYCKLTSVELGSGPVVVHDHAFESCGELEKIDLGGAVHLGSDAFSAQYISELTLPDTLVSMGKEAISHFRISKLSIGSGLQVFDEASFYGFPELETITLSPDNTALALEDGVLFSADMSRLLLYPAKDPRTEYTVPESVSEIGLGAFYCTENLARVNLPDGLKTVGELAFFASGIQTLTLPEGVIRLGTESFACCHNITSLRLPDSLSVIEDYAFHLCSSLSEVILPEGLTDLGAQCFSGCPVTSFDIGPNLRTMGANPFAGAPVRQFTVSPENRHFKLVDGVILTADGSALVAYPRYAVADSYTVPDGVESILHNAFMFCENLRTVVLPDSLRSINGHAFYGCRQLSSITLPDGIESIGEWAFAGGNEIQSMILPDSIDSLGESCFDNSAFLSDITLPSGIKELPGMLFNCCTALEEIVIPDSVETIDFSAFLGCHATVRAPYPAEHYGCYTTDLTEWIVTE